MKRYTTSELRARLSEVFDAAERGEPIVVERRGARFRIEVERANEKPADRRRSLIAWMDPAVAEGRWTWTGSPGRLRFKPLPRKPKRKP